VYVLVQLSDTTGENATTAVIAAAWAPQTMSRVRSARPPVSRPKIQRKMEQRSLVSKAAIGMREEGRKKGGKAERRDEMGGGRSVKIRARRARAHNGRGVLDDLSTKCGARRSAGQLEKWYTDRKRESARCKGWQVIQKMNAGKGTRPISRRSHTAAALALESCSSATAVT
jgi:hypothetical protein